MNRSQKILSGFLALSLGLVGCAGAKYEAANGTEDPSQQKSDVVYNRAACEIEYWDQNLDLDLWNYEFVSSTGGKFGFGNLGIINLLDLSFKVDKATLQMNVYPSNPYERQKSFGVKSNDTDVQFGVNVGFSNIAAGFEHYSKTPVATLTKDALMKALAGIKDSIQKKEWSTRVLRSPADIRDQVTIQAGSDAGITADDEFEVYDLKHHWDSDPCSSAYAGMDPLPEKPIATLKAWSIGRKLTILKIKDPRISNIDIPPGSYVRQAPAPKGKKLKQLARSVKFGSVSSGILALKDGRRIDLVKYMRMQATDAIQDKKWKGLFYRYDE